VLPLRRHRFEAVGENRIREFKRADIAGGLSVAVAVERTCAAALVDRCARGRRRRIDRDAVGQQRMRARMAAVVGQRGETGRNGLDIPAPARRRQRRPAPAACRRLRR
jgi:hypothetical protein